MQKQKLTVALGAFVFALLGFVLYRLQGPVSQPTMNLWGVVSFGFLGASLTCLAVDPPDRRSGPFGSWF